MLKWCRVGEGSPCEEFDKEDVVLQVLPGQCPSLSPDRAGADRDELRLEPLQAQAHPHVKTLVNPQLILVYIFPTQNSESKQKLRINRRQHIPY